MLDASNISFAYGRLPPVISGVSLALGPGEILAVTGASGCGKSTLGRLLAGYLRPQAGRVMVDGAPIGAGWCPVQYVHQSAISAVDPRWRIGRIVEEGWTPDDETRRALGISRSWYDRYPHEVSGGELQRIALLRALAPQTRYLVADELTAMLDPITQARLWQVLLSRCALGLGVVAISHDEALVGRVATQRRQLFAGVLGPTHEVPSV